MSDDDKRVQDNLEQINTRIENWARGGEYGPGGFPKDTAEKDVAFLLAHIADLEEEIDNLREASAPRTVEGDGSDLPTGTVVIDNAGDAWQKGDDGYWDLATFHANFSGDLEATCAPHTIVYTPHNGVS